MHNPKPPFLFQVNSDSQDLLLRISSHRTASRHNSNSIKPMSSSNSNLVAQFRMRKPMVQVMACQNGKQKSNAEEKPQSNMVEKAIVAFENMSNPELSN